MCLGNASRGCHYERKGLGVVVDWMVRWLLLVALVSIVCGCRTQFATSHWIAISGPLTSARMTPAQSMGETRRYAIERGISLSDFQPRSLSFDLKDHEWCVWLEGKQNFVGNHFVIVIDDITGSGRLIPGR